MYLKNLFSFLLALALLPLARAQNTSATSSLNQTQSANPSRCNSPLLKSYGLVGLPTARPDPLLLCPGVNSTCCTFSDQVAMFQNFKTNGEFDRITSSFSKLKDVYSGVVDTLVRVNDVAQKTLSKLSTVKISNCKVMARRLAGYKVAAVASGLKSVIAKMFDYLRDSYKGFYCSLCDASNQRFYEQAKNEVYVSGKFCKGIAENSLAALMYLHVHLAFLVPISSRFLQSCSANGDFSIPLNFTQTAIKVNPQIKLMLEGCKESRNTPDWLAQCSSLCQQFNAAQISSFFLPYANEYQAANLLMSSLINKFTQGVAPIQTNTTSNSSLIPTIVDLRDTVMSRNIFETGIEGVIDLKLFKVVVQEFGIDFFNDGVKTSFDDSTFKLVKDKRFLIMQAESGAQTVQTNQTGKSRLSANLLSAALIGLFAVLWS